MTYDEIYSKIEEFCNSTTPEEYEASYEWGEVDNIITELEEFLKENHENLFWELVDYRPDDLILDDPWQFLQDYPTEKDFIESLLENVETLVIAEWIGFELDRNKVIEEYLSRV